MNKNRWLRNASRVKTQVHGWLILNYSKVFTVLIKLNFISKLFSINNNNALNIMYFRVSSHLSMWTWSTKACYQAGFAQVFFQFRFFPIQCKLKINCHSILIGCVMQNLTKYRCRIRKQKRKSWATRATRPTPCSKRPADGPTALMSTTPWTTKMQNTDAIIPMVADKRNCFLIDIYSYES